jgi:hypothetical protein
MVPELVSAFTQQGTQRGERLCAIVRSITEVVIAISASLASLAVTTALGPTVEPEEAKRFLNIATKLGANTINSIGQPEFTGRNKFTGPAKGMSDIASPHNSLARSLLKVSEQLMPITWTANGVKFSYNWWQPLQGLPFQYYWHVINAVNGARIEYGALEVEGGAGDGGWGRMCASFEGDFTSRNALNMEKLQTWIPGQFGFIRNHIQRFYKDIYEGQLPFGGGPSMMAFMLSGKSWTGNNSFLSDLRDNEKWQ